MMRRPVARDRGRPATAALVLLMLAGLLGGTVRAEPATAATAGTTVFGPKCPDVMVIAARGSGEAPQADWTKPSAYDGEKIFYGAGEANYDVYRLLKASAPNLHFSLDAVMYPADAVFPDAVFQMAAYLASVDSGVQAILADVGQTERICGGGVKYVFTGYSQGAWVVHRALWQLASQKPSILGKVVGVSLFGDPLFRPGQTIVRDFRLQTLLWSGAATLSDAASVDVPKNLVPLTASYCFPNDPVCQFVGLPPVLNLAALDSCRKVDWAPGQCPHTSYVVWGETAKAAAFIEPNLPTRTVWPWLTGAKPPAGTVGVPYEWKATVTPAARTKYIWTALTAPPPGLRFSQDGVLSGIPTTAGTYSFGIKAQSDPQERYVTGTVRVTINPGTSSPSGCSSGTCTAAAWGGNASGELGNGSTTDSSTPVPVSSLSGVTAIAGGKIYSLALRGDGTVWAWGHNGYGQLGNGSNTNSSTPVQVAGLSGVTAVAGGNVHSLALRADGTVWAWGDNLFGQMGNSTMPDSSTPVQVAGLSGVTAIASGGFHSLALRGDGKVWAWGENLNSTMPDSSTPVQVAGLSGITAIAAGQSHSLALRGDGSVWAWGWNLYGQLGNGSTTDSSTPVQVAGLSGVTAVAGGYVHSLALHT